MHSVSKVDPTGETEFAGQDVQAASPDSVLYVSTGQTVHGPPSDPVYAALHLQSALASEPDAESELAAQPVQTSKPVASLYVPAAHGTQTASWKTRTSPTCQSPEAAV